MALAHCILGSFLGVGCHCFPPPLDTFASRCLHMQATWETSISERRNYEREMAGQFCLWFRLPRKPRVLLHAAQICDMGDGFTSPPRKACCGFFFAWKIRRLRPGSNPRSWVPEASMLTTRPPKPLGTIYMYFTVIHSRVYEWDLLSKKKTNFQSHLKMGNFCLDRFSYIPERTVRRGMIIADFLAFVTAYSSFPIILYSSI